MPQDLIKAARLLAGRKLETAKHWRISERQALKLTMELGFQPACGWIRAAALLQGLAPNIPEPVRGESVSMEIPSSVNVLSDEELGAAIRDIFYDTLVPPYAMVALSLALALNPLCVMLLTGQLHQRPNAPRLQDEDLGRNIIEAVRETIREIEATLEESLTYAQALERFSRVMHEAHATLEDLSSGAALDVVVGNPMTSYFDEALKTLLSEVYVPLGYTVEGMPQFDNPSD